MKKTLVHIQYACPFKKILKISENLIVEKFLFLEIGIVALLLFECYEPCDV